MVMLAVVSIACVGLSFSKADASSANKKGLDSKGRAVAHYGSPVIDGKVDKIWSKAKEISPQYISKNIKTSATFKLLWDDQALYVLVQVKDDELTKASNTPYLQDSFEIFLDENNDKTVEYGEHDVHFRVNYENDVSADNGDIERFYTATKKVKGGYTVEARIGLKTKPSNNKVLGIELQVNEAKGSNRVATINVFDSSGTAWNDTSKFGEVILSGKAKGDVSGLNPYDLKNLIKTANTLDKTMYINFNMVSNSIKQANKVLSDKKVTQKQIDSQYKKLKEAINKLELTEEAASIKEFKAIPGQYKSISSKPGTIERVEYQVPNKNQGTDLKKLNVYLPHGYDASKKDQKYNVLYLMHGGGENENLLFGGPGEEKELKKVIDNMIEKGDIDPLIVVTPTFYGGKDDTAWFHEELVNQIIPLVETKYNTHLDSNKLEDIKASRDHRAFGGFSMGSVTTWYAYIHCLDYIKYFIPLSGDCWVLGQTAGSNKAKDTAEYLANVARKSGYTTKDYYIFAATGDLDIAYPNMNPQIEAMKQIKDTFINSADLNKGNFYFMVCDGGTHAWNWVNQYIYGILPDLFFAEKADTKSTK